MPDVSNDAPKTRTKRQRPELTLREIKFAEQFVECGDASAAYRIAGYAERPAESTWVLACRVLRKPAMQKLIYTLREEAVDAARVSVNRLAQGLARIAFSNRADLFDEHGCLLPANQWPADVAATVEGVESEELFEVISQRGEPKRKARRGHNRKVKTARRVEAMKVLATWKKMIGRDSELEKMAAELADLRALLEKTGADTGGTETPTGSGATGRGGEHQRDTRPDEALSRRSGTTDG